MRAVLLITGKDLRQRARDRSLFLYALLLPLGLTVLMNLLLGDVDRPQPFAYAVVDDDHGPVAAAFVDGVLPSAGDVVDARVVGTAEEARRLVADGTVAAAFLLPPGFSDAVASGRAGTVEVVGNPDAPLGTQVARSLATSFTDRITATRTAVAASVHGGSAVDPADLARRAAELPVPPPVAEDTAGRRELDTTTYFAAGMAVFFLFFTVQFGVTGLLEERRDGTLPRLLAAPLRRSSVLVAKLLTSTVVGVVSMAVLVAASSLLIGARWGHPVGVALLVLAGVLAATGVVAVVAVLARTADQAGGWQAAVAVTLGALGGTFFPVAQVGGALAALSFVSPHRWFLHGLSELASGEVAAVLPAVAALCGFAAVGLAVALALTRRAVRP
jgi:ABC-2 type transport system permease protein